jgi:hypothetical protein
MSAQYSWVADELSLISRFRGSSGLGKKFEDDFPLYYSMSISSQILAGLAR